MRIIRTLTLIATAISLNACDSTAPTAPVSGIDLTPSADAVTGALGAMVVQGEVSTPSGAGRRVVTVDALQTPSGQVRGSYRVSFTATGLFLEVAVSCISVVGSTAWVAGHITDTNIATVRVGTVSYFYVTDNGKPHPEQPVPADVISTAKFNDPLGEDDVFCTLRPTVLVPLTGLTGDISIQ